MWCPLYIRRRTLLLRHCPFTQPHLIYPLSCSSTVRNQYCSAHIYITTTYTTTRCSTCCVMYVFTESKKYLNTHIILSPIWCPYISAVMINHCSYSILLSTSISYLYLTTTYTSTRCSICCVLYVPTASKKCTVQDAYPFFSINNKHVYNC